MNKIIPWGLGPFFGQTPETYFNHHLGMHHPENNMEDDLSSTLSYRRDSIRGFIKYFVKFFFIGVGELAYYFSKKRRRKLMKSTIIGELSWVTIVVLLSLVSFKATLVVFILPFVFTRFMMMAGNWGQHAFVDADSPENCYRNSITCINVAYNKKCFNDGYHIVHHLKPALHYTDMPGEFTQNLHRYANEKAIVFRGLDFFMVWFLLMTKNYKTLADRFVHLDNMLPDNASVVAFLKTRTKRIPFR